MISKFEFKCVGDELQLLGFIPHLVKINNNKYSRLKSMVPTYIPTKAIIIAIASATQAKTQICMLLSFISSQPIPAHMFFCYFL